jgi:hypothetical protein
MHRFVDIAELGVTELEAMIQILQINGKIPYKLSSCKLFMDLVLSGNSG